MPWEANPITAPDDPCWIHFTGQPADVARQIQLVHLQKRVADLESVSQTNTGHIHDLQTDIAALRDEIQPWLAGYQSAISPS